MAAELTEREATRRLILEEFEKVQTQIAAKPESWRKLSFEAHKKICESLGDDFINYPEFEFWFSRFARGDFELDYDRSTDPKTRSFTEMPLDVFKNVGEYLKFEERMQLRNVCKDIRAHVDNWNPKVTKITYTDANDWKVWQTSRTSAFSGSKKEKFSAADFETNKKNRSSPGFSRNPISFLMNMLKHPKLQLKELTIYKEDDCWKKLIRELDESNRKLHVKEIEFHSTNRESSYGIDTHYFIPGVLEEIALFLEKPSFELMNEFVESDQCQAAKEVSIRSKACTSKFPLKALYNCPRFSLELGGGPADRLKSKFIKYFNEENTMVPDNPLNRRYPIPETNEFYELEYRFSRVFLTRKQ
ncbi:hypothetical protein GCK72_021194 [Caenorhabditis remanei]|uniref:F-box domain-containing protein n=1 Tax=Caenorhabditis remanei TaxID=31234 RepID=A0A6A5GJ18_CAERE|nr:hypothetical protein GCK72_021194 [Caenorhabditis remanei]KAF1754631.1 hypothetical protein GCK72_021194 [Caenorhabditis remanei]